MIVEVDRGRLKPDAGGSVPPPELRFHPSHARSSHSAPLIDLIAGAICRSRWMLAGCGSESERDESS